MQAYKLYFKYESLPVFEGSLLNCIRFSLNRLSGLIGASWFYEIARIVNPECIRCIVACKVSPMYAGVWLSEIGLT